MSVRLGAVEGWVVTREGETLKTGFKNDFEAVNWMHRRHSFSVDHAIQYEGYDIVLVKDGKVAYSYKQAAQERKGRLGTMELGARRRPEGSEGTAYIDKSGGRWTIRWWSEDEKRYYSFPPKSTLDEALSYVRRRGFKPVVAEPHGLGNLKTRSEHPIPVWPEFVDAYLAAALWASAAKDEEQLDAKYTFEDFTQEAVDRAVQDSNDFIRQNRLILKQASSNKAQHGHDFFLTRNLHGAGFRDHGYGPIGDRLADAARAFGPINAYADKDGKVRFE